MPQPMIRLALHGPAIAFYGIPSTSVLPKPARILAFHGPVIAFLCTPLKICFAPTCEDTGLSWPCYCLSWHSPQHWFCLNLQGYWPFTALLSPLMALPSTSALPKPARILAFHGPVIAFLSTPLKIGSAQTCEDMGLFWLRCRLSWHLLQNRFCPNLQG
ncbi:hypothetical protein IV203_032768 [Nitzschia inconspicua]|uniref:Uncharacterized protein n=1 Tax=Nitzschia inconspicua TaxID=303405 RepID=A0A9K3PF46_9STRA|nr:hypothetical protein IV203_032768 [Nitzschia inconspicua]